MRSGIGEWWMHDDVFYWEVSVDEYRTIFKETIHSLDTHEAWGHTDMYVTRAFPCTTVLGYKALHVTLLNGDAWLVVEKN
jgi:hypothetical protein